MSVWDWDDDEEVDEEYVRRQREARDRRAVERPVKPPPPRPVNPAAEANRYGKRMQRDLAIAGSAPEQICIAQATVRYPKGHEQAGLPVLGADGRRSYRPCKQRAMKGQRVCVVHGGMAPNAQAAAKMRLLAATEPLVAALVRIGLDERLTPADRTRAINSALDRAGFRGGLDVNIETPGWQQLLGQMFGSSEVDSPDRPDVVEAEVVDIAELNARIGERFTTDEATQDDPRGRPGWVNGSEALPAAWRSQRQGRARR